MNVKKPNTKSSLRQAGSLGKLMLLASLAVLMSACHATIGTSGAIREYHRGLNGMITEGKASPDIEGAYWKTQKQFDGLNLGGGQ